VDRVITFKHLAITWTWIWIEEGKDDRKEAMKGRTKKAGGGGGGITARMRRA
jgi:hypothetical protein